MRGWMSVIVIVWMLMASQAARQAAGRKMNTYILKSIN